MEKIKAVYEGDSKRYHKYTILPDNGFVGSIYVPKGKAVPDTIEVALQSGTDGDKEVGQ